MMNIGTEERKKAHAAICTIALIFTHGERRYASLWYSFYDSKPTAMAHLAMTWCTCTLTRQDVYMGESLMRYINAIAGVIGAMKLHADRMGEVFAMSPLAEPRVSYLEIIRLTRECTSKMWGDTDWMKLMEF
jgi:hypothetical protein